MTIKEARKRLGVKAKNISDEQLQQDIDTAELFKEIFFNLFLSKRETIA